MKILLAFLRPALDLGGIAGGITDIIGGSKIHGPNYYTPAGAPQADQAFMQALQAISQAVDRNTGMIDPVLLHSYSQMLGIDLSGLISGGAQAGDQYKQLASQTQGFGANMAGAGNQIMAQAFDPQNTLHDYQKGVAQDDVRAADTSRGLAMSPYSAGNEADAMSKFEMDWQNRQLGRQQQGIYGANAAYGGAQNFGGAAPGYTMAGAQAPIAGQTAAYGAPMDFSSQFLGAEGNMMAPEAAMASGMALPYLSGATNAASGKFNQDVGATMDRYGMMAGGFNNMFGGGAGDPSQWFGFQGGNPFSMGNWQMSPGATGPGAMGGGGAGGMASLIGMGAG